MRNTIIRSTALLPLLAVPLAARAQAPFMTGFEAPTYTAGQSALGVHGWQGVANGYLGGTTQTVSNERASEGSQSLRFNDAADANSNALRETQTLGTTGTTTLSTDVWLGGGNGAGRIAELRFSQAFYSNNNYDSVISVGGDGTVRAGIAYYANSSAYPNSNIGYTRFANAGTFATRWLHMSMKYVAASGLTTATLSGFGDGQVYSYSFTGNAGGGQIILASDVNYSAANQTGSVYFDNVNGPNPVPEPTTFAALGLGAVGVAARRRCRR